MEFGEERPNPSADNSSNLGVGNWPAICRLAGMIHIPRRMRKKICSLALWPYMVPLFVVYTAEYAMQSGTWAAMGIPSVQSAEDRTASTNV